MPLIIRSVSLKGMSYLSSIFLKISSKVFSTLLTKSNTTLLPDDFKTYAAESADVISITTNLMEPDLNRGYFLRLPSKCCMSPLRKSNQVTVLVELFLASLMKCSLEI